MINKLSLFSFEYDIQTFFREKADPEATQLASVAHVTELVQQVLKLENLPSVERVSEAGNGALF